MENNNQGMEFMVRASILDRPRRLTLDPGFVEFDDKDLVSAAPTRFLKNEIEGVRYGIKPIQGYLFRIGRIYCVDIRDAGGRVLKIRLKSVYRVRRKLLGNKYQAIANAVFRYYLHDKIRHHVERFRAGHSVELLGIDLDSQGVLFDEKAGRISWHFLGTKRYWHYYTLFSEAEPGHYRAVVFLEDWNAGVLQGVIEAILKDKFPGRKV